MNKKFSAAFILASMLLIIGIVIFALSSNSLLKQRTISFYEKEAKQLTRLVEKSLHERYHDSELLTLFLGKVTQNDFTESVSSEQLATKLNGLIENRYSFKKIAILDLQGKVLAETNRNSDSKFVASTSLDQLTIANADWFKAIRNYQVNRNNHVFMFGPQRQFIDKQPGSYDILFGSPIFDDQDKMVGIWVNIVDFNIVEDIFKETYQKLVEKNLYHVELSLIDNKGYLLVDYDPIAKKQDAYIRDFNILNKTNLVDLKITGADRAIAGFSGTELSHHEINEKKQITIYNHFSGYKELQGIGWSTLIRIDESDIFSAAELLNKNMYLLLIFIFVLLSFLGYFLYKNLVYPLNKISSTIIGLSKGKLTTNSFKHLDSHTRILLEDLQHKFVESEKLLSKSLYQQQTLELQRSAINSIKTGIVVVDIQLPGQPIIFINKAFSTITGFSAEEVLGKNCRFLQGPNTEKDLIKHLSHAIHKGKACDVVITNYTKTGNEFINNLSIGPVYNSNKELTHYIGVQTDITEEKRKEEASTAEMTSILEKRTKESKDSADRLRAVFDTALDGMIVLNSRGTIKDVNRSLELIFGRTQSELIDKNISILLLNLQYNNQQPVGTSAFSDWLQDYIGNPQKIYGLHKAGHQIPIELSVGETKLESEMMFVAIMRDITFQELTKQRELKLQTQLHEQELIYRTAFNQAAVGIARIGIDSRFVEVNTKMCEILGYEEQVLLTKKIKDVTYKKDVAQSFEYIKDLLEDKKSFFNTDKRYIRGDGTVFWANLSVSLVRDAESFEPKFFIAVVEDITEQKEFAEDLFNAKNERDKLLNGINLASEAGGICNWSFDITTGALKWDPRMYDLYEIDTSKPLSYDDWKNALHPDDVDKAEQEVADAIKNVCSIKTEFRIVVGKKNTVKWIQCSADLSLDEDNNPVTMYGINIDLTDEKNIQQKLEKETQAANQASQSKSRFLATMSHEIRTPMNGVIGMVDLLRNTSLNADQKRMLTTVRDSSFALLDIINDILDFSKIESGQLELDTVPCNVLSLIEKTMDSLWISASNKNVDLYIEPDLLTPIELMLDSVRVRQILLNIVGNAIKFSGGENKQGRVIVKTDYTNDSISLEVIDNGVGISEEQQRKLFVPFSQADSSTTRKFGGTGLGLSITKSFTELMKGNIAIQSELGKGSSFKVTLPNNTKTSSVTQFEQLDFSPFSIFITTSDTFLSANCLAILSQLNHDKIQVIDDSYELITQSIKPAIIISDSERFKYSEEFQQVKTLFLNDDPIKTKGHIDPYSFVVGNHPLKPTELIFGLAILCGLKSPTLDWSTVNTEIPTKIIPQTKAEAEVSNTLILVAEDQPTNRLVLGKQLESLGYAFEMAEDGVIALELWKSGRFGLLLTDYHMPNMDGLELTRTIRNIELERNMEPLTIIAVTANAMVGESEKCFEAGMNDYIAKPIEIKVLRDTLTKYISLIHSTKKKLPSKKDNTTLNDSAIDFKKLEAVIGTDDREITNEILTMFWSSVIEDFQAIKEALDSKQPEIIRSKSHAAKGASVSSGAINLGELFQWIEKNNNNFEGIESQIKLIDGQLLSIKQVLEAREIL
ncbi:PAS domain S-box protein [Shewanella goraebulensis]|uniref:PAS domain S-box protein n=1 Tax=Shewanella goraebulensis TaxID=3050637 RepID=UPI00254A87C0|nr:PAS domain S-box protein [Shewanella goraebulensis]